MEVAEFFKKISSTYLWKNIMAMFAVVVALVLIVVYGIDIYTHHGEKITVPDVRKHLEEDGTKILEDMGFQVEVIDTDYVKSLPAGAILDQVPLPGSVCKSGRIIYLTINALDIPTLVIPDVIDNASYREAKAKLTAMGFKVGEPEYVPGEKDWVYGIKVKGRNRVAGDRVPYDAEVIIQVGNGRLSEDDTTIVETDTDPFREQEIELEEQQSGGGDVDEFEVVE